MKRFTRLFVELDRTTRTTVKLDALRRYFAEADPADAAWALAVLSGRRGRRPVSTTLLRAWVATAADLPLWMVEECHDAVGDLAETLALLLPDPRADGSDASPPPLHQVMNDWILPLAGLDPGEQERRLREYWRGLSTDERFIFQKLLTGGFRVGVGQKLVTRALAEVVGMDPATLAHRLTGRWEPTAEAFLRLTSADAGLPDPGRPYPFMLAHPLAEGPEEAELGPPASWAMEWKWDGIRAQLIHREGEVLLWSRGEEVITPSFPEIAEAGRTLPPGTVLDGELLPWREGRPLPFAELQRRLGRKRPGARILREVPVVFLAYDLLESGAEDRREDPFRARRRALEELWLRLSAPPFATAGRGEAAPEIGEAAEAPGSHPPPAVSRIPGLPLLLAPLVDAETWADAAGLRASSRQRLVEGLMLKGMDAPYRGGRARGGWWKWKVDPFTLDAVLLYAKKGHGRRASLFTDFTFGVRDGDGFVPVASAYSGLTDAEFRKVDRWIRRHVTERFGPVRAVEPGLVFELAFEGIRRSTRHRAGVALRFPRMSRWRQDKEPADADTLASVLALLPPDPGATGEP
ncbi:MAG: ATP-dependent DNA ligase [Gemmatimonadales bacterium]|nr:MAG: ATP-dependent DNA ligase [Gemmatimonadales bacterium]